MILIVEDEKLNIFLLKNYLESKNRKTLVAENGAVALKMLYDNPDITHILLDLNMPIMNGYEFLIEIANNQVFKKYLSKIIVISTIDFISFENEIKSNNINVDSIMGYLSKPVNLPKLLNYIS